MGDNTFVADPIASSVRREIGHRLDRIAEQENVRYLLAIESGSRAWGFPSPDSDFDVRFVYVRPRRDYLALQAPRDVIERPIVDEIDLNGWDIRKALGLLLKDNAVLSEWIESPIRYRPHDPVVDRIAELGDHFFNPRGYARHYSSLGRSAVARWSTASDGVPIKKYFYALRPALSIRALRLYPTRRPPMKLQQLMDMCELPDNLYKEIEEIVAIKAMTREAGPARPRMAIDGFIAQELECIEGVPERKAGKAFAEEANALFLALVDT